MLWNQRESFHDLFFYGRLFWPSGRVSHVVCMCPYAGGYYVRVRPRADATASVCLTLRDTIAILNPFYIVQNSILTSAPSVLRNTSPEPNTTPSARVSTRSKIPFAGSRTISTGFLRMFARLTPRRQVCSHFRRKNHHPRARGKALIHNRRSIMSRRHLPRQASHSRRCRCRCRRSLARGRCRDRNPPFLPAAWVGDRDRFKSSVGRDMQAEVKAHFRAVSTSALPRRRPRCSRPREDTDSDRHSRRRLPIPAPRASHQPMCDARASLR